MNGNNPLIPGIDSSRHFYVQHVMRSYISRMTFLWKNQKWKKVHGKQYFLQKSSFLRDFGFFPRKKRTFPRKFRFY